MDLLIATDLVDAFVDIHIVSGDHGEPVAKRTVLAGISWVKSIPIQKT